MTGATTRKAPGPFVPLDVSYAHDRDIALAGEAAELLYVRGIAYSRRHRTAGLIPDHDLDTVAVRLRKVEQRIASLVAVGLWTVVDGGWQIRSWERWNESDEEMETRLRRDRERKRKKSGGQTDSTRTPDGIPAEGARIPLLEGEGEGEGEGVPSSTDASVTTLDVGAAVQRIVAAYVDACPEPPSSSLKARIGKSVRDCLKAGNPAQAVLDAAVDCAEQGWQDVAVQVQRNATTPKARPTVKPSTTDSRVASVLSLKTPELG